MDDQNQPANSVQQPPQQSAPPTPVGPEPSQVAPAPSVGSVNKEAGPVGGSTHEVMQPAGEHVEPQISPEVAAVGVEVKKEVPDLTLHDKNAGVAHSGPTHPHPTAPSGIVSLSVAQLKEEAKHKDVRSSRWWEIMARLRQLLKPNE